MVVARTQWQEAWLGGGNGRGAADSRSKVASTSEAGRRQWTGWGGYGLGWPSAWGVAASGSGWVGGGKVRSRVVGVRRWWMPRLLCGEWLVRRLGRWALIGGVWDGVAQGGAMGLGVSI